MLKFEFWCPKIMKKVEEYFESQLWLGITKNEMDILEK